jgi:putative Holliday junction resolvase
MGLDIGDSRIGVALSDPLGIMATPLVIINRADEPAAIKKIADIVREKEVGRVIAGLPLNMDGSRGPQAEKTVVFVEALSRHLEIPIEYQDERLSTVSARELIQGVRKTTRDTRYDAAAAALILQSYLDEVSRRTDPPGAPDLPTR